MNYLLLLVSKKNIAIHNPYHSFNFYRCVANTNQLTMEITLYYKTIYALNYNSHETA